MRNDVPTLTAPSEACPVWCMTDEIHGLSSPHAGHRFTTHTAFSGPLVTSRGTVLEVDVRQSVSVAGADLDGGPIVSVWGDDGSGSVCGLSLPVADAGALAEAILTATARVTA